MQSSLPAWRKVAAKSLEIGLPMPTMTSALTFLDGYTTARLPANMLQAQRDYFGAHTYERIDQLEASSSILIGRALAAIPHQQRMTYR